MDKGKAIELLKKEINKIPHLRRLRPDNQKFKLWHDKVYNILEIAFGKSSGEYERFVRAVGVIFIPDTETGWQKEYNRRLDAYETALKSIVQKYELLGIGTEHPATAEPKDAVEVPSYLFNKMQFHPRVIEASRKLFNDEHYRDAIFRAFTAVNNFVKEKSGLSSKEIRGMKDSQLMAKVFDVNNPIIKLNELIADTDISEQEGFKFLFMGATIGIRNPKAHDNIIQTDPFRTLEYLSLASLLMKRVEEGVLVKISPPRKKWNLQRFLVDTRERCKQDVVVTITKLYDFTKNNSDSISWGTGAYWGSFTFRKSGHGIEVSIFTVYSDSSLTINFGQMKGKSIKEEAMESLRVDLNRIPEIKIPRDAVTIGKWHDISVEPLINTEHLNKFQEAVLSLCKNIESGNSK